jgi:hypothetical protein
MQSCKAILCGQEITPPKTLNFIRQDMLYRQKSWVNTVGLRDVRGRLLSAAMSLQKGFAVGPSTAGFDMSPLAYPRCTTETAKLWLKIYQMWNIVLLCHAFTADPPRLNTLDLQSGFPPLELPL